MTVVDDTNVRSAARTDPTLTTVIDRQTDLHDIVALSFKRSTFDRRHAFVRSFRIDSPIAPRSLLHDRMNVDRCATDASGVVVLATDRHGTVLIQSYSRATLVSVAAIDEAAATALETSIRSRVPQVDVPGHVPIRTWHSTAHGTYRSTDREIAAASWATIEANYASSAAQRLRQLMAVARPVDGGRLILWHGEPGTGKTTALRALMQCWSPWCSSQYIADPERFFADPGYISEVLSRPLSSVDGPTFSSTSDSGTRWRLIVAEDSDEYLRASARRDAGAGLGRLLNLADGVLGQGYNALILLTTNEELQKVHPALTRPGRCLARVEFTRFPAAEARQWLPAECPVPDQGLTLAEMYESSGRLQRISNHDHEQRLIGQYL